MMLLLSMNNYQKKVIFKYQGRYFLVQSYLKLSQYYNVIGFWSNDGSTWGTHVSSLNLTESEFNEFMLPFL